MISTLLAGALSALIGVLSGQALVLVGERRRLEERLLLLERAVPELISRGEVQSAFAQVAQIEAQRQAQMLQQSRPPASVPTRSSAAFAAGELAMPPELNTQINAQLEALNERMARFNQQFGLS